jgi:hypothetical protein
MMASTLTPLRVIAAISRKQSVLDFTVGPAQQQYHNTLLEIGVRNLRQVVAP